MSDMFDPKKIIDFSKDYYAILGLVKENLPLSSIRKDKVELANIIERAFRKQARTAHPDFGGSNEAFLDPLIFISPIRGFPPLIKILSIYYSKI